MALTGDQILRRVAAALTQVTDPRRGDDVISSGRVRELQAADDGVVRFRFLLQPDDPGSLVRDVRAAAERVDGVSKVRIDVGLPAAAGKSTKVPSAPRGVQRAGTVPAPTPAANLLPNVHRVVAVSSGKGGVGKSTVAVNLAAALSVKGLRVGLLDADVYGPNVPTMLGERRKPRVSGSKGAEKIEALEAHGVKLMSLGLLLEESQPAIMRGPLISGILKQFCEQVEWGDLDYLVVDMPPGTGDAQLSLVQTVRVDGVVMVTTPQDVATGDVRRAIKMFEKVETRVIGVVENMSSFTCPCCSTGFELFGSGGGSRLADSAGIPLLGKVPLELSVREGGDSGAPAVLQSPDSASGRALLEVAARIVQELREPATVSA